MTDVQPTSKKLDLLPCPFCGGPPRLEEQDSKFFVHCVSLTPGPLPYVACFASMGESYDRDAMPDHMYGSAEDAVGAWNKRHSHEPETAPCGCSYVKGEQRMIRHRDGCSAQPPPVELAQPKAPLGVVNATQQPCALPAEISRDIERKLIAAVHEADDAFEKAGMGGSKTWVRDFLLPRLETHGLGIGMKEHLRASPPPSPEQACKYSDDGEHQCRHCDAKHHTSAAEQFIETIWEVTDDCEENAQTGDVTMDHDSWEKIMRAIWDLGGRHRERLSDFGYSPETKEGGQ